MFPGLIFIFFSFYFSILGEYTFNVIIPPLTPYGGFGEVKSSCLSQHSMNKIYIYIVKILEVTLKIKKYEIFLRSALNTSRT